MPPPRTPKQAPKLNLNQLNNAAISYLGIRPRTRAEIFSYLSKKSADLDLINQSLSYLESINLIDDRQFADWFIRSRLSKSKGPKLIAFEIKRFGISTQTLYSALDQLDPQQLAQSAQSYLKKHLTKLNNTPSKYRKNKAHQLLYQRGFDKQTRDTVIDELLQAE